MILTRCANESVVFRNGSKHVTEVFRVQNYEYHVRNELTIHTPSALTYPSVSNVPSRSQPKLLVGMTLVECHRPPDWVTFEASSTTTRQAQHLEQH